MSVNSDIIWTCVWLEKHYWRRIACSCTIKMMMIAVKSMRFQENKLQNSRKTHINLVKLAKASINNNNCNNKHSDSGRREHRATMNLSKSTNKHTISLNSQITTTPNRINPPDKLLVKSKNCNMRNNNNSSKRKMKDSLHSMLAMRRH